MEIQNQNPNPLEPKNWLSKHMLLGYVFLFLVLAAIVSGIYYWQFGRVKHLADNSKQITDNTRQVPEVPSDWKTYTNSQYGFELTFTDKWKGYKVQTQVNKDDTIYKFQLPATSSTESLADKNGYLSPFTIDVWNKSAWDNLPDYQKLGDDSMKNNSYVFVVSYFNDPPSGFSRTDLQIDQILSTFKFTDSTTIDTSTWKTYTNSQYGFEFKYPSQALFFEETNSSEDFGILKPGASLPKNPEDFTGVCKIEVWNHLLNPNKLDLNAWFNEEVKLSRSQGNPYTIMSQKETMINGNKVLVIDDGDDLGSYHRVYYLAPSNDFVVQFSITCGPDYKADGTKIFDQILSTFKFTDSTTVDTSTWKTLSGCVQIYEKPDQFSISYPANLPVNDSSKECLKTGVPDVSNILIPAKDPKSYPTIQLSMDYKYIFYVKTADGINYEIVLVDLNNKHTTLLDSFTFKERWYITGDYNTTAFAPEIIDGKYILYNWFNKNPDKPIVGDGGIDDIFGGKIKDFNNKTVFEVPCSLNIFSEVSNLNFSKDNQHIVTSCDNYIYVGNWQSTKKLTLPSYASKPGYVSFDSNTRIRFQDFTKQYTDCRADEYSANLDGTGVKYEGTSYACF
jgi:hypothetical protein